MEGDGFAITSSQTSVELEKKIPDGEILEQNVGLSKEFCLLDNPTEPHRQTSSSPELEQDRQQGSVVVPPNITITSSQLPENVRKVERLETESVFGCE